MIAGTHFYPLQERVVYGRPAAEVVRELTRSYGAKRPMIVSNRSLSRPDGLAAKLADELGAGLFAGIGAHAPREDVIAAAQEARNRDCDLLIAFGGGSVIDATKVVQLCLWADLRSPEALDPYRAPQKAAAIQPGIRMIAIPTTLSAAEFTRYGGTKDTTRNVKEAFIHPQLTPVSVILDPRVTLKTPPHLWLSTGIKGIDHAVEQLYHPHAAPFADALAADGLKRLAAGLRRTKAEPGDLAARLNCQFGMWLAVSGAAMGRRMGISHAIGHALGATLDVAHGLTSCVILPAVLEWTADASRKQQAQMSQLMGHPGMSAGKAVRTLVVELGLPTRLDEIGVGTEHYRAIAEHSAKELRNRETIRQVQGAEDVIAILKLAEGRHQL